MTTKTKSPRKSDLHSDWLTQVDTDGPFLALPVVKDIWPDGVDRLSDGDDRLSDFKSAYAQWQRALDRYTADARSPESKAAYDKVNRKWIDTVLDEFAEWDNLRDEVDVDVLSPGEQITVTATSGLSDRDGETVGLLLITEPNTGGLREIGLDGWAASDIDRFAMLLRKSGVEVGVVTDGQWWALVSAREGKPTGSGMVNALTWAEEPLLRDAFFTLINQRRFRSPDAEQRLTRLFERSELEAETITEKLGTQVRKSVELLVQAFSEARLAAHRDGTEDPLPADPDEVYQAAVTVMMRIVFLLFAEERDMLPTEQLYWESYAIKDLLTDLRAVAVDGEELLDETYDVWHRLLAVSEALYGGVNYDEMRMPAYGGSLLDPNRFAWMHAVDDRGLRLEVSDRVMMHVLESVQTVLADGERRRISLRDIDVEQIGYIYEGLLGYSAADVTDDVVLGLVGKDGEEPEIPLGVLEHLRDESAGDPKETSTAIREWVKEDQPAATSKTVAALTKLLATPPTADQRAELTRLLTPVAGDDPALLESLLGWGKVIRRDLRNIPMVFPRGGLVVIETPSRKNAGAHYTPRSLAEEVVLHALEPLVYAPGPLQTNDDKEWKLKSSAEILDLKVADIAAGSGAFLVAAARYLGERVVEAWTEEGMLTDSELAHGDDIERRAVREVISRCLYGADINPMAVEMCKLSLWLVSMDKTKPFSFVDDKIFCGNSLLGIADLDQLRYLHLYPEPTKMHEQLFVDIDAKIATATRLRHELANPVEENDPMRSSRAKQRLLEQSRQATDDLRLIADGVVAAGLPLGGKPGRQLDDAYKTLSWQVQEAFPAGGVHGHRGALGARNNAALTPSVQTDYERWKPLHWAIEVPDVVVERGGFDAIIGNPPFLGFKKISPAFGGDVRAWYANVLGGGSVANADLVAFFVSRAWSMVGTGVLGLITTNTIAEGDTRAASLDRIVNSGGVIYRANRSKSWPSLSVNLEYAEVWITCQIDGGAARVVDNVEVESISAQLEATRSSSGFPLRLEENRRKAYQGCIALGKGFILSAEEAAGWIRTEPKNSEVLFPFLNGDDVNSRPDSSASRWVINFGSRSLEQAQQYGIPYRRVEEKVRPERAKSSVKRRRDIWWQFAGQTPELNEAIRSLDEVLVIAIVSKVVMPLRVSTRQIISNALDVFLDQSYAFQAVLSSSVHRNWAITYGSTLETRVRYVISDVFETFPFPCFTDRLEQLGSAFDVERREIMLRRRLGLTALYNLVDNPDYQGDSDVERMRKIAIEIDEATVEAYGWDDVVLDHGFHVYRRMERWTISPTARVELLDRLLELNHERARAEGQDVPKQSMSDLQETLSS